MIVRTPPKSHTEQNGCRNPKISKLTNTGYPTGYIYCWDSDVSRDSHTG